MGQSKNTKTLLSGLLILLLVAGSASLAAAVCANVYSAAGTVYCQNLSVITPPSPSGLLLSPCDSDPGCGPVRRVSTNQTVCVPLDTFCCVQTDCLAASLGGSCQAGSSAACSSAGTFAPLAAAAPVAATPTTPVTAPVSAAASGNVSSSVPTVTVVNTTSNTVTVCYELPINAIVV